MILILSKYENEGSTMDIQNWLNHKSANYQRLNGKDLENPNLINIEISNENTIVQLKNKNLDFRLNDIQAIWYRRWYDYAFALESFDIFEVEKENEQLKKYIFDEFKKLSTGFYKLLDQNNPYWLSHPDYISPNKLISLLAAKAVGLNIPKTLITNSKQRLVELKKKQGSVITKNIGEVKTLYQNGKGFSTYTTTVEDDFITKLSNNFPPTKFQENIEKAYEIRSFVLAKSIYSMAIFSQLDNQTATDFRMYNEAKPNRNVPYQLPQKIEKKLLLFMEKMNLNTGSIDLIKTKTGDYVFLEVNPVGQFSMISFPCNYYLEEKIANFLIQKDMEYGQ